MATPEVGLEERAQSRSGGCGDADASFDCRPDGDVGGGVEEIFKVGEVLDIRNADDCCGRGTGRELVICGFKG